MTRFVDRLEQLYKQVGGLRFNLCPQLQVSIVPDETNVRRLIVVDPNLMDLSMQLEYVDWLLQPEKIAASYLNQSIITLKNIPHIVVRMIIGEIIQSPIAIIPCAVNKTTDFVENYVNPYSRVYNKTENKTIKYTKKFDMLPEKYGDKLLLEDLTFIA